MCSQGNILNYNRPPYLQTYRSYIQINFEAGISDNGKEIYNKAINNTTSAIRDWQKCLVTRQVCSLLQFTHLLHQNNSARFALVGLPRYLFCPNGTDFAAGGNWISLSLT